jgi:hypothetical protein
MKFSSKQPVFAIVLFSLFLGACNVATDKDYDNAARDICGCMETAFKDFPKPMKELMVKASKMPGDFDKNFQSEIENYFEENPLEAIKIMAEGDKIKFNEKDGEKCMDDLKKKYDKLISFESDSKIEQKLLDAVNKIPGCELTSAALKASNKK